MKLFGFCTGTRHSATAVGAAAALFVTISGPAIAGPVGAAGDIYVIGGTDLGLGYASPAILQYDGATGDLVGNFATRNGGQYNGMTWGPNGNLYATFFGNFGNWRIQEYDGQTGAFIQNVVIHSSSGPSDLSVGKGLAFGPDGDLYVGDWYYGTITRYDGTTFAPKVTTEAGGIGTPNGMRFAPNGNLLVVSGGFNTVEEYNVAGGGLQPLGTFATTSGSQQAQDLTFGPNGNLFVALGAVGGVAEFDGVTGAPLGMFVPTDSALPNNGLAFDNFGRLLVADIYPVSRVDAYDAGTGAAFGPFLTDGFGPLAGLGEDSIPTIITIKPVPTPGALSLLAAGGFLGVKRRRR